MKSYAASGMGEAARQALNPNREAGSTQDLLMALPSPVHTMNQLFPLLTTDAYFGLLSGLLSVLFVAALVVIFVYEYEARRREKS